jgi:hypothetical protein
MAKLTYQARQNLPKDKAHFVFPDKAPGPGSYPIFDKAHARNALSRVGANGSPEEKAAVVAAVCRKFSDLPTCQERKGK